MKKRHYLLLSGILALFTMVSSVSVQASEEEEKGSYEPLHYETDKGTVDYVGQEYATAGMLLRTGEDPSKTIILNFDYTVSGEAPSSFSTDFEITAYQNDLGLNTPASYNEAACTEGIVNYHSSNQLLPDQTVPIGVMFVLEDDSPVTVIVHDKESDEYSDLMLIDPEPYVDNSFNLNYLYGRWQDDSGTKEITFTSSTIRYSEGTSSREMTSSLVWADADTLHQPIDEIGKTLSIVREEGQPLRLVSDVVTLTQIENWPEAPLPEEQPEQTEDPAAAPEQMGDPAAAPDQMGDPAAAPDQMGDPAAAPDQMGDPAAEPDQPHDPEMEPDQPHDPAAEPEQPDASAETTSTVQLLYDNLNCYVAVTDVWADDPASGVYVMLQIENRTDRDLLFSITDAAINGTVVPASWSVVVSGGQTANETIFWTGYDMDIAGIETISDIQVSFRVNEASAPDGVPLHEDRMYIAP